jgi:choline dehydrogenase-like flavoprotein
MKTNYDIIVIGSGAGGGTMAWALRRSGAEVLILERGGVIPREPGNRDPGVVWQEQRYRARERWVDGDGKEFLPYTHY